MENLTVKFVTRLTIEDDNLLERMSAEIGCTASQLGRYAIRKYLAERLRDEKREVSHV